MKKLMALFVLLYFFSCSKDKICSDCNVSPYLKITTNIHFNQKEFPLNINRYSALENDCSYHIGQALLDEIDFNQLVYFTGLNLNQNGVYAIIPYLDVPINSKTISYSSIKGYSIFETSISKGLVHKFFFNRGGEWIEDSSLQKNNMPGVVTNVVNSILLNRLFSDCTDKSYIMIFSNLSEEKFKIGSNSHSVYKDGEAPAIHYLGYGYKCAKPCENETENHYCLPHPTLGPSCHMDGGPSDPCESSHRLGIYESSSLYPFQLQVSYSKAKEAYDAEFLYAIRNILLSKSEIGQKYISYYYLLSLDLENIELEGELMDETTNLLLKLKDETFRNLLDLNADLGRSLMSESTKNELRELLLDYKGVISEENKLIIDDILMDLDTYYNYSISEVLEILS